MKILLTLLVGFVLTVSAQPRPGPWTFLGEAHVNGEYRAIRLRVENAPAQFDRVLVHFGNGTTERLAVRHRVRAGSESPVIDLPGARRVIESVEFWRQRPRMSRAPFRPKVVLFGLR